MEIPEGESEGAVSEGSEAEGTSENASPAVSEADSSSEETPEV